jgi:hypothetical protein
MWGGGRCRVTFITAAARLRNCVLRKTAANWVGVGVGLCQGSVSPLAQVVLTHDTGGRICLH